MIRSQSLECLQSLVTSHSDAVEARLRQLTSRCQDLQRMSSLIAGEKAKLQLLLDVTALHDIINQLLISNAPTTDACTTLVLRIDNVQRGMAAYASDAYSDIGPVQSSGDQIGEFRACFNAAMVAREKVVRMFRQMVCYAHSILVMIFKHA